MIRLAVLVALLASVAAADAQTVRTADVVTWRVRAERAEAGGEARLVLDATIAPGWRLYALDSPVGRPFRLELDALPDGVEPGPLRQAAPREAYDEAFDSDYTYFAERAQFVQPLRVGAAVTPGRWEVRGAARYAVCDDSICLPPARTPFRVPLLVE